MKSIWCTAITLLWFLLEVECVKLVAYISQYGLHGEMSFAQHTDTTVRIESSLEATLQYPDQSWSWAIHQVPVDYSDVEPRHRCDESRLGKELVNLDDELGYLTMPGNESSTWEHKLSLTGPQGLWGKSLLLVNPELGFRICATITTRETNVDHVAEARFHTPIGGSIFLRWLAAKESHHRDTLIYSNLFHLTEFSQNAAPFTNHSWKIYVTDIFDTDTERPENNCNVLQLVFDQQNQGNGKAIGDIDLRLGSLKIATHADRHMVREVYNDEALVLLPSDLTGPQRQLYIVVFDNLHPDVFLSCAKIRHVQSRSVRTFYNQNGLKGEIRISQRFKFEPAWLNFTLMSASNELRPNTEFARDLASINIRNLPPDPVMANQPNPCESCGSILNPVNIELDQIPPPGLGTQDQYAIGDLTGKLLHRNKEYKHKFFIDGSMELNGIYWDVFLSLEGKDSVVDRGLTVQTYNRSASTNVTMAHLVCGTLVMYDQRSGYQTAMSTAEVLFRYPIVGRVLFRQPRDQPWADTTIIVEYLIHADGATVNNTDSHRWAVHAQPPGKDFYNWTARCQSAKDVFNPYKVEFDKKNPDRLCNAESRELCRMGDLSNRFGALNIAGRKGERVRSRTLFVDQNLPLSGHHGILGKSLVIYHDIGPVARGDRIACSIISGHHWRKAVARDWYANGFPLTLTGKLEMFQQSEYGLTNVEVGFKGLIENSGYHVHITPVEGNLEFPCEGTTLYGHWNPRNVDPKNSPEPTQGSTDQYEMGDLSGKFGNLDGYEEFTAFYNDTNLPLFGYETVLGRSIVIHKKDKMLRWACSTLERGYSPSEAREIRGIASFHHPLGYAYGYVRFTQLIHNDGSKSDTVVEVNLRHPGKFDRNVTRNHHWNIFVNPVGVDATVQQTATRCVAGGYIWNPFYTQLADPLNIDLYKTECGADNPLRCYVGDVSARVGTIDLGVNRAVFSDPNFPLEGTQSALGRSIVLFGPNFSSERYACANIEPDHDIIKYINLQKPPKFVVAQFLEDIRHVMGLPEWMLSIDSRRTKALHGGACIQMLVHFKGGQAHKIEKDFSVLISNGRLSDPSIAIPGYVDQKRKHTLSYRTCGVRDPNEKNKQYRKQFGYNGAMRNVGGPLRTIVFSIIAIFVAVA